MPTGSTAAKKARARKSLGLSLAVPILLATPAAWSLLSTSETVPGNAVVSEREDARPWRGPLTGAPAPDLLAPSPVVDEENLRGFVSRRHVAKVPCPPPAGPVPTVPSPLTGPHPTAEPPRVIPIPEAETGDALAPVHELIDASAAPAIAS